MYRIGLCLLLLLTGCDLLKNIFGEFRKHAPTVDVPSIPVRQGKTQAVGTNMKGVSNVFDKEVAKLGPEWKLVDRSNKAGNLMVWYRSKKGNLIVTAKKCDGPVKAKQELEAFIDALEPPVKNYSNLVDGAVGSFNDFYETSMITFQKSSLLVQVNAPDFETAEPIVESINRQVL